MKVRLADTTERIYAIQKAVRDNDGYCPCRLEKNSDTKCMCAEFRNAPAGETCHCGLYYKLED